MIIISKQTDTRTINTYRDELEKKYDIKYLPSDFKKNEGYKQSIELSKKYSDEKVVKMINGVLDKIHHERENNE